jgi:flavin-dependent dehydrogenase
MTDVDVLVVGGGPIGLATAIEARLAGLSAVVVEPRGGAIDKACGEGLMPGAVASLARLGVVAEGRDLSGFRYLDGARSVDYRFRGAGGIGMRRTALHAALARRADELGVERIEGRVDSVTQSGARVSAGGVTGSWLLACDGLHSTIRRTLGLERDTPRGAASSRDAANGRRRFGLRQHFRVEPWTDLVEVHWTAETEAYVTPVGPELVGVALLGRRGADYRASIAAVPGLGARLDGAAAVDDVRGAGPLRQRTRARAAGRVLLVGDASGYVDALTGEGIRVGLAQSRAAVAAVLEGGAARYEKEWAKATRDFRVITSVLLAASQSPARRLVVPAARMLPSVFGAVVERLAR